MKRVACGRGLITGSTVWVPLDNNKLVVLDLLHDGEQLAIVDLGTTGNLTRCDEHLIVTGEDSFAVHPLSTSTPKRDFK